MMDERSPMSKYWMPLVWATNIINRARRESLISSDQVVQTLLVELSDIRRRLGSLISYDTVCVPLVYTQVSHFANTLYRLLIFYFYYYYLSSSSYYYTCLAFSFLFHLRFRFRFIKNTRSSRVTCWFFFFLFFFFIFFSSDATQLRLYFQIRDSFILMFSIIVATVILNIRKKKKTVRLLYLHTVFASNKFLIRFKKKKLYIHYIIQKTACTITVKLIMSADFSGKLMIFMNN